MARDKRDQRLWMWQSQGPNFALQQFLFSWFILAVFHRRWNFISNPFCSFPLEVFRLFGGLFVFHQTIKTCLERLIYREKAVSSNPAPWKGKHKVLQEYINTTFLVPIQNMFLVKKINSRPKKKFYLEPLSKEGKSDMAQYLPASYFAFHTVVCIDFWVPNTLTVKLLAFCHLNRSALNVKIIYAFYYMLLILICHLII